MCKKCKSEVPCTCECSPEHIAAIQEEFYPFRVIKANCDKCTHPLQRE